MKTLWIVFVMLGLLVSGCGNSNSFAPATASAQNQDTQTTATSDEPSVQHIPGIRAYSYQQQTNITSELKDRPQTRRIKKANTESAPSANSQSETQDNNPSQEGSSLSKLSAPSFSLGETGFIKPTVYYHAIIDEDKETCGKNADLKDRSGKTMISICERTEAECKMEGSCVITQNKISRSFNITSKIDGIYRFFETTHDNCKFGYGVRTTCLDPFYTVAADLSIYKPGDVIYIPAIRGLALPDGSKHSGYFIVRDSGNRILGAGRFDFYCGFSIWKGKENPFLKIGLSDISTRVPYVLIKGSLATKVLASRSFPEIPRNDMNLQI